MAGTIGDMSDLSLIRLAVAARGQTVEDFAEKLHQIEIRCLAFAADAVVATVFEEIVGVQGRIEAKEANGRGRIELPDAPIPPAAVPPATAPGG